MLLSPVNSLSRNCSIFFSRLVPFFLSGFSGKQPSASGRTVDDPPVRPGEGGPLTEASTNMVLFAEQWEVLPLVSWSSVVLVVAVAEVLLLAFSLKLWPSLSLLLELLMEQMSWWSPESHRDASPGPPGRSAGGGASTMEPQRRHRLVRLSKVQLGLMAQKSSSLFSFPWKE